MKINFINHWRWSEDWAGFVLFNVWKTKDSFGIQLANIGIEFLKVSAR